MVLGWAKWLGRTGHHIRDDLQVSVDDKDFIDVDACLDLELDITIAGENTLDQLKLVNEDLNVCKDTVKVQGGDALDILGEKLIMFKKDQKQISSRIVFMSNVYGIHMAWFTAVELGCLNI